MSNTPWRDSGGRNRPPCKDCPDRKPACSDHCKKPEFLAWKEQKRKITRARMEEGPCVNCKAADTCDVPCGAYWRWWDARMEWLKWRLGL